MKTGFSEYYRPTDEQFAQLWAEATVVLDTSVLLDLYEYSQSTVDETFAVLQTLADAGRLWLTHQTALEYHRSRPRVIVTQETEQYDIAFEALAKLKKTAKELREKLGQHAYLDSEDTVEILDAAISDFEKHLRSAREEHPNLRIDDPIRDRLDMLYEGRVGTPWDDTKMGDVSKRGKDRFERRVPPGYEDRDKPAHLRYGDLVFWLQVLEHASTQSCSVIVVTNDSKEDWWVKPKGQVFGPRPELRAEFAKETSAQFYMYSHDRFMGWGAEYLKIGVEQESIDEIREVRETRDASEQQQLVYRNYFVPGFAESLETFAAALESPEYKSAFQVGSLAALSKSLGELSIHDYARRMRDAQVSIGSTLNGLSVSDIMKLSHDDNFRLANAERHALSEERVAEDQDEPEASGDEESRSPEE